MLWNDEGNTANDGYIRLPDDLLNVMPLETTREWYWSTRDKGLELVRPLAGVFSFVDRCRGLAARPNIERLPK